MPRFCAVYDCSNNRKKNPEKNFFGFPGIRDRRGRDVPEGIERRKLWVKALRRADLTPAKIRCASVCSDHFLAGKPAELGDTKNPDYVPTQKLGYVSGQQLSVGSISRYKRARKRLLENEKFDKMPKKSRSKLSYLKYRNWYGRSKAAKRLRDRRENEMAVCSSHFVRENFLIRSEKSRLKPDAVPSIFPWNNTDVGKDSNHLKMPQAIEETSYPVSLIINQDNETMTIKQEQCDPSAEQILPDTEPNILSNLNGMGVSASEQCFGSTSVMNTTSETLSQDSKDDVRYTPLLNLNTDSNHPIIHNDETISIKQEECDIKEEILFDINPSISNNLNGMEVSTLTTASEQCLGETSLPVTLTINRNNEFMTIKQEQCDLTEEILRDIKLNISNNLNGMEISTLPTFSEQWFGSISAMNTPQESISKSNKEDAKYAALLTLYTDLLIKHHDFVRNCTCKHSAQLKDKTKI